MKFFIAFLFAIITLATADVSHLNNNYLPPHHDHHHDHHDDHHHHEHHGSASNTYEHYESAPSDSFSNSDFQTSPSAPGLQYLAPEESISNSVFSSDSSFSAPESAASFTSSKTTEYTAPAINSFESDSTYSDSTDFSSDNSIESAASAPSYSTSFTDASYSASEPAASTNVESKVDTHYSADGGYVY